MGQLWSGAAHGGAPGSTDAVLPESPLLRSPRTELDGRLSLEETRGLQTDDAPAAPGLGGHVLDGTEKEDCEFFWSFLADQEKELDARTRFLASLRTVCRLRLEGRYLADGKLEAQHEVLLRKNFPSYRCPVMCLGRHTVLIIAAKSSEIAAQISQHLSPCVSYICSLAEESVWPSFDASIYDQILQSLDILLQTLVRLSPGFATLNLVIMKALMPCINSEKVRVRRCAVERIASLCKVLVLAFLTESSSQHDESMDDACFSENKSDIFLGQLLGHLTLCYADEDQDIKRGSTEVLHAVHSILAMQQGYDFRYGKPNLSAKGGCWDHFCSLYAVTDTLVEGSWLNPTERGNFILTILEGITHPRVSDIKLVASTLDAVLRDKGSQLVKVPQIVQSIYYHLTSDSSESLQDVMIRTLLQITRLDPDCVVWTVLRDTAWSSTIMWQTMVSEPSLAVVVVKSLLKQWPQSWHDGIGPGHNCTFHLAIRHAMHTILHLPSIKGCAQQFIHKLYGALLFEIFFVLQCSQRGCFNLKASETNTPRVKDIRRVVENMRALFQHLTSDSVVEDIEKQGGWDMLKSLETYHRGVAVLTRALRNTGPYCCAVVFKETVITLCQRQEHKEIGAMAVFIELLDCVEVADIMACIDKSSILSLLQSHLQSQNLVLRDLAVTSLVRLSAIPTMAVTLQDLLPGVTQQLKDAPCSVGAKAVTVLHNMLRPADRQKAVPIALQLPELLLPFFLSESGHTRQLSILLCKDAMEIAGNTHTAEMKKEVRNILLPLFFHLHDQDQSVAQASWEALLCAAKLLKRKHLRYLLKTAQPQRIGECLLAGHRSRADQFLEQSLSYLRSPQEPLQETAVRFIGLAGRHLRHGREEKLTDTIDALRSLERTSSSSISTLVAETVQLLQTAPGFSLQALLYRLSCCSCAQG